MRTHATLTTLSVCALLAVAGCPQGAAPATFTAGSGGADIGTIDDGKGNEFLMTELAGGGLRIDANGTAGDLSLEIDQEGRVTRIERNKLTLNLSYNADGSANATGEITVGGETHAIDTVIPADQIPTAKTAGRLQGGGICGLVDRFCDLLDAILVFLEAALLDQFGYQDNPDKDPLIDIANVGVQLAVNEAMERITGPAKAFCEAWPEIRPELGEICN